MGGSQPHHHVCLGLFFPPVLRHRECLTARFSTSFAPGPLLAMAAEADQATSPSRDLFQRAYLRSATCSTDFPTYTQTNCALCRMLTLLSSHLLNKLRKHPLAICHFFNFLFILFLVARNSEVGRSRIEHRHLSFSHSGLIPVISCFHIGLSVSHRRVHL